MFLGPASNRSHQPRTALRDRWRRHLSALLDFAGELIVASRKGGSMTSVWSEAPRRGAVARARVASIADIRAIERTPFVELLPSWSILGMIEHAAAQTPGKTAMVVLDKNEPTRAGRRLSYVELAATIRATANRLHEVSGNSRPVVSILTPLLAESFIAIWAGASAGLANPINPFLRVEHVANIMNAAGTTVLVCGTASDGPGAWNEVEKLRAMVPTLREVWCVGHASDNDFFRRQIDTSKTERLTFERSEDPDRTAALLHTGGTTAAPKLVRLTERGMLLNAWCCGTWAVTSLPPWSRSGCLTFTWEAPFASRSSPWCSDRR